MSRESGSGRAEARSAGQCLLAHGSARRERERNLASRIIVSQRFLISDHVRLSPLARQTDNRASRWRRMWLSLTALVPLSP
jgi:hypothetical protein